MESKDYVKIDSDGEGDQNDNVQAEKEEGGQELAQAEQPSESARDEKEETSTKQNQTAGLPDFLEGGKVHSVDDSLPEWEAMPEIPEHWRPLPLFLVRSIPTKEEVTEEELKALLESVPHIKVRSINFDLRPNERMMGRQSALVRLQPPPLPWKLEPANGQAGQTSVEGEKPKEAGEEKSGKGKTSSPPTDGDVLRLAAWAVERLKSHSPPLQLAGETLSFEVGSLQVQLYVGNLSPFWQEDGPFVKAMESYGKLERAFVMRNAAGLSKGYGFVEFALPGSALACKQAMDEIEKNMRPDPRKPAMQKPPEKLTQTEGTNKSTSSAQEGPEKKQGGTEDKKDPEAIKRAQALKLAGWPEGTSRLVKLLRAEWAIMRSIDVLFSRVLYVANLRTNAGSRKHLRDIFEQFGEVAEVTVPINKTTLTSKGFAFVAFSNGLAADRAYRALEKSGSEEIGGALVSFANSAKHTEMQSRVGGMPGKVVPGIRQQTGPMGRAQNTYGRGAPGMPNLGPPGSGRGMAGRGMGRGGEGDLFRQQQQQQLQMQAGLAAQNQMARQMEMRMQQQMRAQQAQMQAQMQAQLRQAQMQVQQFQQQTQQLQRQAAQAQAKAVAEAEARKRAEDEARRAAAAARVDPIAKRAPVTHYSANYSAAPDASAPPRVGAGFGHQPGYTPPAAAAAAAKYGASQAAPGYGNQAGGYGGSQATYGGGTGGGGGSGSYGSGAYSEAYGGSTAGAYSSQGYGSGDTPGYGQQGGYGQQEGYGHGSYGHQSGYGYNAEPGYGPEAGGQAGYAGAHSEYGAAYGQGASGYGGADASGYDQPGGFGGYGQPGGQKRQNPYQQASYGYGSGDYGPTGGGEYGKRQRY